MSTKNNELYLICTPFVTRKNTLHSDNANKMPNLFMPALSNEIKNILHHLSCPE